MAATFAPPLAKVGQSFGAPEYFSLMVLGLIAAVVLAHGSVIKAIAMIILGLLIGLIGTDGNTGGTRFTFGIVELTDGIDVATLAIGIFGIGEIITNLTRPQESRALVTQKITRLWPTREDFQRAWPATLRGTALGSVLGVLPGGGATLSSFAAYALEKRSSKHPAQFGNGAVEGVAGLIFPEDKAGFLVGALAALMSKSHKVGAVCGPDGIPPVWRLGEGYKSGAAYVDERSDMATEVFVIYHDSGDTAFDGPEWGAQTANAMLEQGADVVFGCGGRTGNGAIIAAAQADAYVIGVDTDQYLTLPEAALRMLEAGVDGIGIHLQAVARRADPTLIERHYLDDMARAIFARVAGADQSGNGGSPPSTHRLNAPSSSHPATCQNLLT